MKGKLKIFLFVSFFLKVILVCNKNIKKKKTIIFERDKFKIMYQTLERWIRLKIDNRKIEFFLKENGFQNIAVYGMGDIGRLFIDDLKESEICIKYVIDQKAKTISCEFPVYNNNELFPDVDVVVVTAVAYFEEIKESLEKKISCPIISLDEIVCNVAY